MQIPILFATNVREYSRRTLLSQPKPIFLDLLSIFFVINCKLSRKRILRHFENIALRVLKQ